MAKSFGYFQSEGREYCITDPQPPRPLLNYFWNDCFLSGVNQFCGGEGAYGGRSACYIDANGKGRCSILRDGGRYFYIQDGDELWNPGWNPLQKEQDEYACVHGLGYSMLKAARNGLKAELRGFVDDSHPAEIWTVRLTNETEQEKMIRFTFVCDFLLEGYARYSDYNSYVYAQYDETAQLLLCCNEAQERPHPWFNAFMAGSLPCCGFESSRRALLGAYGSFERPQAILNGKLQNGLAACEKMAGALQYEIYLKPGQTECFHLIMGAADNMQTALRIREELFAPGKIDSAFDCLLEKKYEMAEQAMVNTPDEKVNMLTDYWLKQQVKLCAESGRDTGKGFRDQLQDAWAISAFDAKLAQEKILETLRYQYSDGRCVRGWLPLDHHVYSDGPVWIALAVNGYLKETGDTSLLMLKVPFLDHGESTVWERLLLSARFLAHDLGERGLVLARDGDWNDSLNGIGTGGKGESVWTSIAACLAMRETGEIARHVLHDETTAAEMDELRTTLARAVNDKAWDSKWYLAAINDLGNPVGSHTEATGQIYLNSQTWAILSEVADEKRKRECLAAIDEKLDSPYGPLTLFPPYRKYEPNIGRLTSFVPGIWENGTPYCHGGTFKAVADCYAGRGNKAYETLCKIMPDSEWNPSTHSGCEPYAFTNMYLGPDNPRAGETMFAWVTGTAGWIYRLVTQYMLGFQPDYDGAKLCPCIPAEWKNCSMKRKWRGAWYDIEIHNPNEKESGVQRVVIDGVESVDTHIPVFEDGKHHRVEVWM